MRAARAASLMAVAVLAGLPFGVVRAATIGVPAGDGLGEALARAAPGDTLRLAPGVHRGSVVIGTRGLTLEGEPGAVVDGLAPRAHALGDGART